MTRPEAAAITDTLRALGGLEADALLVLLRTGLRLGELLALQPQDWDSDRCALHVQRSVNGATKSGRRRIVDVPDDVMAVLEQVGDGQRLFPLCDRTLRRHMNQACKQAGIPHFRIHDLRHTRVTHLLLAGVPVAYVSEQAGHSSPSYTMRVYGHVAVASRDARREWANA
jgi:integrase